MSIETTVSAAVGSVGAAVGYLQAAAMAPGPSPVLLAIGGGAVGWLVSWGAMKATVRSQDQRMDRWERSATARHDETNGKLDKLSTEVGQVRDRVSRIEGQLVERGD